MVREMWTRDAVGIRRRKARVNSDGDRGFESIGCGPDDGVEFARV